MQTELCALKEDDFDEFMGLIFDNVDTDTLEEEVTFSSCILMSLL